MSAAGREASDGAAAGGSARKSTGRVVALIVNYGTAEHVAAALPALLAELADAPDSAAPAPATPTATATHPPTRDRMTPDFTAQGRTAQSPAAQGAAAQSPAAQGPAAQGPAAQNPATQNPATQNPETSDTATLDPCVIVVDNASPGGDADRLAAHLAAQGVTASVRLIRSSVNGGFAAGVNLGLAACRSLSRPPAAVLILNPDAEPLPGALRAMGAVLAAEPRAGIVGPRLAHADGETWAAAFHFPAPMSELAGATGLGALIRRWPRLAATGPAPMRVDWVSGAAMLVRWPTIEATGGFDEGFFLYYEEVDFMRRAAALGWETWHAPAAVVRHAAGAATGMADDGPREGRMPDYWFRSWRRYFAKSHGPRGARLAAAAKLAGLGLGWLQRRARGLPQPTAPGMWGDFLRHGLLGRMDPPPEGR